MRHQRREEEDGRDVGTEPSFRLLPQDAYRFIFSNDHMVSLLEGQRSLQDPVQVMKKTSIFCDFANRTKRHISDQRNTSKLPKEDWSSSRSQRRTPVVTIALWAHPCYVPTMLPWTLTDAHHQPKLTTTRKSIRTGVTSSRSTSLR